MILMFPPIQQLGKLNYNLKAFRDFCLLQFRGLKLTKKDKVIIIYHNSSYFTSTCNDIYTLKSNRTTSATSQKSNKLQIMSCLDPDDMADSTKVCEFVVNDQVFTSFIIYNNSTCLYNIDTVMDSPVRQCFLTYHGLVWVGTWTKRHLGKYLKG